MQDPESDDEVFRRFLELLTPAQRMKGLTLEQCLVGFTPEEIVWVFLHIMPDDMLRALNETFIEKLPGPSRNVVRQRLGR